MVDSEDEEILPHFYKERRSSMKKEGYIGVLDGVKKTPKKEKSSDKRQRKEKKNNCIHNELLIL